MLNSRIIINNVTGLLSSNVRSGWILEVYSEKKIIPLQDSIYDQRKHGLHFVWVLLAHP